MPESKPVTDRFSADAFGETDFETVDGHIFQPEEYDELPELTDEMMNRADVYFGDRLVRRGSTPKLDDDRRVHLSSVVLAHFRATGPGREQRIDAILRDAIERENAKV